MSTLTKVVKNKDDKKNNLKLKIFSETKNLTTKIKIKKRKKRIDLKNH